MAGIRLVVKNRVDSTVRSSTAVVKAVLAAVVAEVTPLEPNLLGCFTPNSDPPAEFLGVLSDMPPLFLPLILAAELVALLAAVAVAVVAAGGGGGWLKKSSLTPKECPSSVNRGETATAAVCFDCLRVCSLLSLPPFGLVGGDDDDDMLLCWEWYFCDDADEADEDEDEDEDNIAPTRTWCLKER
jgi:hypothetical protein